MNTRDIHNEEKRTFCGTKLRFSLVYTRTRETDALRLEAKKVFEIKERP